MTERQMFSIYTLRLRHERHVVHARQRARDIAALLGFDHQEQIRVATGVSEVARNAFRYATGGAVDNFQIALSVGGEAVDVGFSVAGLGQVQVGRGGDISVGQGELQDFFQLDISSDGYSAGVALNIGGLNAAQAQQVAAAFEQAARLCADTKRGPLVTNGKHERLSW